MSRKSRKRYEMKNETIDGQRTGMAPPFPLWRLPSGLAAHRSNIREWYCPRPE
jgi:hypothetical protein